MSFRAWLSCITIVLVGLVVFWAWPEIVQAFHYLGQVNLWILLLVIPLQFISYLGAGEMIYSYLRGKGDLKGVNPLKVVRLSLELNFVNHVFFPSGPAGIAYMVWQLRRYGVKPSRSTMAQITCGIMRFLSYIALLAIGLLVIWLLGQSNAFVTSVSLVIICLVIVVTAVCIYLLTNSYRLKRFAVWLTKVVNKTVAFFTRGREAMILAPHTLPKFVKEFHSDYVEIRRNKKILKKPFLWGAIISLSDTAIFLVAFWSFGVLPNPVMVLLAYGISVVAGAIAVTPGGTGVYELIMITCLAAAGMSQDVAIAGILLARVLVVAGTVSSGYVFYQLTVLKNGRSSLKR